MSPIPTRPARMTRLRPVFLFMMIPTLAALAGLSIRPGKAAERVVAVASEGTDDRTIDQLLREADSAFERGEHARSRELYAEAVRRSPASVHALRRLAFLQAEDGELDRAEDSLRRALTLAPEDAELSLDLARVLSLRGRYDEAERIYVGLQDKKVAMIEAHLGRAFLRSLKGEYDEASRFYHDIMRASPGSLEARVGMVRIRHQQGLDRSAREQINNIILDHPNHVEARTLQSEIEEVLRPRGGADGFRFSDDDGNRVDVAALSTTFRAEPQTTIRIALTRYAAEFRCEDRTRCDEVAPSAGSFSQVVENEGATLVGSLTSLVIRSITFHARVGAAWQEDFGGDSRTVGIGGGFIRWEVGPRLALRGSGGREALFDTAVLIDRGIRVDTAEIALEYKMAPSWMLLGEIGYGSYSDSNSRRSVATGVTWTLRAANPGVRGLFDLRYRTFNADRDNGYFDPQRFDSELLTVAIWDEYLDRRIFWRIEGTYGRQDFDTITGTRLEAGTNDKVLAAQARFGLMLGARATLETFYSSSDYALQQATGFKSSRSGFDFRLRF